MPNQITVFVGNLAVKSTFELREHFERYGKVIKVYIARDRNFGFVTFTHIDDAQNAINHLHQTKLCGNRIIVKISNYNAPKHGGHNQMKIDQYHNSRRSNFNSKRSQSVHDRKERNVRRVQFSSECRSYNESRSSRIESHASPFSISSCTPPYPRSCGATRRIESAYIIPALSTICKMKLDRDYSTVPVKFQPHNS